MQLRSELGYRRTTENGRPIERHGSTNITAQVGLPLYIVGINCVCPLTVTSGEDRMKAQETRQGYRSDQTAEQTGLADTNKCELVYTY